MFSTAARGSILAFRLLAVQMLALLVCGGAFAVTGRADEAAVSRPRITSPLIDSAAESEAGSSQSMRASELPADKAFFAQDRDRRAAVNGTAAAPLSSQARLLLIGYCVAIVGASILGGWIPTHFRLSHTRMQTIISFVGGLMLGIGVFHLLPHSTQALPTVDSAARWMMGGMVAMFFLIRTFHFHHHGPLEVSALGHSADPSDTAANIGQPCQHDHDHDHDDDHDHDHDDPTRAGSPACDPIALRDTVRKSEHLTPQSGPAAKGGTATGAATSVLPVLSPITVQAMLQSGPPCDHAHQLSWLGIAVGLSVHTAIDGIALAASVQAESTHPVRYSLFGLGTFLAIMLHKPLDAVSITSLMAVAGWERPWRHLVNGLFSLMCPLGALVFFLGLTRLGGLQQHVVGATLAFSAGVFICISLSDLLPEMEFHAHNRARLTLALLGGILLAFGITFLEPRYLH